MLMNSESVTAASEAEVVEFLFHESTFRGLLRDELGITTWQSRFKIPRERLGISSGPGDIDVLLTPHGDARSAIAFECKRAKVQAAALIDPTGVPNKLRELPKAIRQTSELAETGFHQSFLMVIVQIDARLHPAANWLTRGLRPDLVKTIRDAADLNNLHSDAGLMIVELTQPADIPIEDAGGMGLEMLRTANQKTQPYELTRSIQGLFAHDN